MNPNNNKKSTIFLSLIALAIIAYIVTVNIIRSNTQKRMEMIYKERFPLSDSKQGSDENEVKSKTLQDNNLFFSFEYPETWACEKDIEEGNSAHYYLENSGEDDFINVTALNMECNVIEWLKEIKKDWQSEYKIKKTEEPRMLSFGNNTWLCSQYEFIEDGYVIKCFCGLLSNNGRSVMLLETTTLKQFEEKARNKIFETFSFNKKDSKKESWDEESAVYTNFEHGFAWALPITGSWRREAGTSKHTIFKAVEGDTRITAFVSLTPLDLGSSKPEDFDSWLLYDSMLDAAETKKEEAKKRGQEIYSDDITKAVFCGKHAIKERSIFIENHGTKQLKIIQFTYSLYYEGNILGVSVKSDYDTYRDLFTSFDVESILDSFALTYSDEKTEEFTEKVYNKKIIKQL